jgi:hypothetical protein
MTGNPIRRPACACGGGRGQEAKPARSTAHRRPRSRGHRADAEVLTPEDLRGIGLWWPLENNPGEVAGFLGRYAAQFAIPLATDGLNLGVDTFLMRSARIRRGPGSSAAVAASLHRRHHDRGGQAGPTVPVVGRVP